MASTAVISTPISHSSILHCSGSDTDVNPKIFRFAKNAEKPIALVKNTEKSFSKFPTFGPHLSTKRFARFQPLFSLGAAPSVNPEYTEEPATKVKFQTSRSLPGCSSSLSLLGTGYREKVFAIIGVKVYAVGLYTNESIFDKLDTWRGRSPAELEKDSSCFDAIFQAPIEISLHIVLVRDVDGKTFWDALDEAISPRITSPTPVDESALSTFRSIFQDRPLNRATSIFLTWMDTEKMLVCVSDGVPSAIDATIESSNVTSALFDVFLGGNPVSPSLKASVSKGLAAALSKV